MTTLQHTKSLRCIIGGFFIPSILVLSSCVKEYKSEISFEIALGKKAFNDTRLSYNNTKSCASCHNKYLAFTDGYRTSITANGEHLTKNSPTLLYLKDNTYFDYNNPDITSLEQQHLRPLLGKHPVELGTDSTAFLSYVSSNIEYQELLNEHNKESIESFQDVISSIASYVKTLSHYNSPYDRYMAGDSLAMTANQIAGFKVFSHSIRGCIKCHTPPNFTNTNLTQDTSLIYPTNHWNYDSTPGPVKIPTLRNVEVTGPYLHDGSMNTIGAVIDKYNEELFKMNGIFHVSLKENERAQLIDFLYALTDDQYKDK